MPSKQRTACPQADSASGRVASRFEKCNGRRHTKHKDGLHLCARVCVRVCVLPRVMCAELCSLNCTRRALVLIVVVVVVAGKLRTGLVLIRTMQEDGLIDASEAQRLKADLIQERRDDASHLPKCALPPHRKGRTAKRPTSVYWPLRSWDLSFSSFKTAHQNLIFSRIFLMRHLTAESAPSPMTARRRRTQRRTRKVSRSSLPPFAPRARALKSHGPPGAGPLGVFVDVIVAALAAVDFACPRDYLIFMLFCADGGERT